MEPAGILLLISSLLILVQTAPVPGHSHHHVHHRIHVPQKIKTVYHTKIIKVPEHHHYYHEKEKVVPLHIEKEKYVPVPVHVPVHVPHKEEPVYPPLQDEFDGHSGYEHSGYEHSGFEQQHYDGTEHNILKKHAPNHQIERKKQRRVR